MHITMKQYQHQYQPVCTYRHMDTTYTSLHGYVCTLTQKHKQTYTCTYYVHIICTCIQHTHTCTQNHIHIHVHLKNIHVYTDTHLYTYTPYTCTYIHTTHTVCTHDTHVHTETPTCTGQHTRTHRNTNLYRSTHTHTETPTCTGQHNQHTCSSGVSLDENRPVVSSKDSFSSCPVSDLMASAIHLKANKSAYSVMLEA